MQPFHLTRAFLTAAGGRHLWLPVAACAVTAVVIAMAGPALAQSLSLDLGGDADDIIRDGTVTSRILQLIALITVLSLAPSILVMMTSFTRIVVVLSLLRTALGVQQTPPNIVLVSLALFLTGFIMQPVFEEAYQTGIVPLVNEEVDEFEGFELTVQPFKRFMAAHTRDADLALFIRMSDTEPPEEAVDTSLHILIPAFMISELRRAFEIGFLLFLPFLIIDLVIASILMSMGMMMVPPVILSLPFKIIFFVLVDGWRLVAGSLVQSYGVGAL